AAATTVVASSSPATRGGCDRSITVHSGATYRSPTARSTISIGSSKNRTADLTLRTGRILPSGTAAASPRIQPRIVRPWNGIDTRLPTPAPVASGSRYVNGRSSSRRGTSTQTSTGPDSSSGIVGTTGAGPVTAGSSPLLEGASKVVRAVGLLPGEALAAEVPVGRGLPVDRPPEVQVADDGGRAEVEQLRHRALQPFG